MKRMISLLVAVAAVLCLSGTALAAEAFDLNKATLEQLKTIPDMTDPIAKAIVETAKKTPFKDAADLLKVPGLDNKMLEKINPVKEHDSLWYDPDNAEMTLAPSKC